MTKQELIEKMAESIILYPTNHERDEAKLMLQVVLDNIDEIVETDNSDCDAYPCGCCYTIRKDFK
jgi:hypothetical protein